MNAQMIEGLIGACANIKMAGTPMSVYRQARAEGDTEKMKRALGYAGECTERAAEYQDKLDEGIKAEREEEERREDAAEEKRLEEQRTPELKDTDTVEISSEAKAEQAPAPVEIEREPVVYTASGEAAPVLEPEPTVSVTA